MMKKTTTSTSTKDRIEKLKHAGTLIVFFAITASLLHNYERFIPDQDQKASAIFVAGVFLTIALHRSGVVSNETYELLEDERVHKISLRLMTLEIVFTLLIPWILLVHEKRLKSKQFFVDGDDDFDTIGFLLTPHLYFFQVQIMLDLVLLIYGELQLVFPYTCVANAYRLFPMKVWIQRSLEVLLGQLWEGPAELSLIQYFAVFLLPIIGAALWVYSSFIFIPFEWYPQIRKSQSHVHKK